MWYWGQYIRRFLEDLSFIPVTDFANTLKPRHKNGKRRR